jgi:hypothetical protein
MKNPTIGKEETIVGQPNGSATATEAV